MPQERKSARHKGTGRHKSDVRSAPPTPPQHAQPPNAPNTHPEAHASAQSRGLLRDILLELGLTETVRALEVEVNRKLQPRPTPDESGRNVTPSTRTNEPTNNNNSNNNNGKPLAPGERLPARRRGGPKGLPLRNHDAVDAAFQASLTPLWRALASSPQESTEEAMTAILQSLSRLATAPLKAQEEEETMPPLLTRLAESLLGKPMAKLSPVWAGLMAVFVAYADALWAQLRLAEAVAMADVVVLGWARHRQTVLERLAQMQESLQRLLLEANQLERTPLPPTPIAYEHCAADDPSRVKNSSHNKNSSSSNSSKNCRTPDGTDEDVTDIVSTELGSGVAALFCHCAPLLRHNADRVSTWVMQQCGRCARNNFKTRKTEPYGEEKELNPQEDIKEEGSEEDEEAQPEGKQGSKQERSSRRLWELLLGIVRSAALVNGVESPEVQGQQERQRQHQQQPGKTLTYMSKPPIVRNDLYIISQLRLGQVALRVQLLAWIIGSVAELIDCIMQHNSISKRLGNVEFSTGAAVTGMWYQKCALQLCDETSNRSSSFHSLSHNSVSSSSLENEETGLCEDREELGEERPEYVEDDKEREDHMISSWMYGNKANMAELMRMGALELLTGAQAASDPGTICLLTLRNELNLANTNNNNNNKSKSKNIINSIHGHSASNHSNATERVSVPTNGSGLRLAILTALSTGRPYENAQLHGPRPVSLHLLARTALRTTCSLLELQDVSVPVELQLQAMENITARALISQTKGVGEKDLSESVQGSGRNRFDLTGSKGLPIRRQHEGQGVFSRSEPNEPIAHHIFTSPEGVSRVSSEFIPAGGNGMQQRVSEVGGVGYGTTTEENLVEHSEVAGEPIDPRATSSPQIRFLLRMMARGLLTAGPSEETPASTSDPVEDEEGDNTNGGGSGSGGGHPDSISGENVENPNDAIINEVQVVTVSECGSLMAFMTTKGRLVVFALRGGMRQDQCPSFTREQAWEEESIGTFCEELILDTFVAREKEDPPWYDQPSILLDFSPDARFLLCSVQSVPPHMPEGKEVQRKSLGSTGKMFIYSLHRVSAMTQVEGSVQRNNNDSHKIHEDENRQKSGDAGRLFNVCRIHKSPVIVARWVDPRFWREKKSPSVSTVDNNAPAWYRSAHWRLSLFQCLSAAQDNLIIRWSPVDGTIIQTITTLPLCDILVSPLMQSFYTINQYGQLSMYDAWNENNVESATENTVPVSQRGLPSSLSSMRPPTDGHEDEAHARSVAPLADGELQQDFFVGARMINFDRTNAMPGGTERESLITRLARSATAEGVTAGVETRAGSRLGRRILLHMLRRDEDYASSQTQAVLEPSSDSVVSDEEEEEEEEGDDEGMYSEEEALLSARRRHRRGTGNVSGNRVSVRDSAASFFLTQQQQQASHRYRYRRSFNNRGNWGDGGAGAVSNSTRDRNTAEGEAILYSTGSRLVFEEVAQALCHTARIWQGSHDSRYAPPPLPYHLLSMSVSGSAVWDEEDDKPLTCHRCRFHEKLEVQPHVLPACAYYSDVSRGGSTHRKRSHSSCGSSPIAPPPPVVTTKQWNSSSCVCRQRKKSSKLAPTAANGRYMCIMSVVGPNRALLRFEKPLEFRAGIYACVVFDLIYGTVVRVIPVCSTQPRSSLTENGIITSHSNTKKAPIYMLRCSATVVQRPMEHSGLNEDTTRRESFAGISGVGFGLGVDLPKKSNHESESSVLVAIGGLHSTAYVFDALSGSRLKVIDVRKHNNVAQNKSSANGNANPMTETVNGKEMHPPSKRARRSYVNTGASSGFRRRGCPGSTPSDRHNHDDDDDSNNNEEHEVDDDDDDEEEYDDDDEEEEEDDAEERANPHDNEEEGHPIHPATPPTGGGGEEDTCSTESRPSPPAKPPLLRADRRHTLVRQLTEKCGAQTMLLATLEMLRVVPHPLTGSFSDHVPLSAAPLTACPSFVGQMRLAAKGTTGTGQTPAPTRAKAMDPNPPRHSRGRRLLVGAEGMGVASFGVPFAMVAAQRRELRRAWEAERAGVAAGGKTQPPRGETALSSRMRCGVVNTVALWWDRVHGGVYLFSGDEYGGLFMTGGPMPR